MTPKVESLLKPHLASILEAVAGGTDAILTLLQGRVGSSLVQDMRCEAAQAIAIRLKLKKETRMSNRQRRRDVAGLTKTDCVDANTPGSPVRLHPHPKAPYA